MQIVQSSRLRDEPRELTVLSRHVCFAESLQHRGEQLTLRETLAGRMLAGRLRSLLTAWRLLLAALVLTSAPYAVAHVPHDVVTDLVLSPAYSSDRTVFAIVRGNLLHSTDGGSSWRLLTRGLESVPTSLQVSPDFTRDATLFAGSERGVYRSRDAGAHWQECNRGLPKQRSIASLAISPRFAKFPVVLAMTSGGIFRTLDAGEHWKLVLPIESDVTALDWTPGFLVAGTASGQLHLSTDSGGTWSPYGQLPGRFKIDAIEVVQGLPAGESVFVGTRDGLFRSAPGSRFTLLRNGIPGEPITSLSSLDENGSVVLLAATRHRAIFRSDDRGTTWRQFDAGLKTAKGVDHAAQPQFSKVAVADDSTVLLGGLFGVFRSEDFGRSWEELYTLPDQIIVGLDVSPAIDASYTIGLTTYNAGAYSKSADGSAWQTNNRGLPMKRLGAIAYSPDYARDRVVLTGTFGSLMRSVDGGASWKKVAVKYKVAERAHTECNRWAKPAPRIFRFRFPLGFAFSPTYAKDRTVFAAYHPEGLIRSVDGGASFSKIWHGCGDPVVAVVTSPDFHADRTLFALVRRLMVLRRDDASPNDGIYRSRDAGRSWQRVSEGLASHQENLAISPQFGRDRTVYASGYHGLWRSQDAGQTWQPLKIDGRHRAVARGGFAVSPFAADHRELLVQLIGGPLYRCRDYGDRFEVMRLAAPTEFSQMRDFGRDRVPLLAYSPHYPSDGTLYAASIDRLFKSTDRGLSWVEISRTAGAAPEVPRRESHPAR